MRDRTRFINQLESYYNHLLDRLTKGSIYVDNHPDDIKAYKVYTDLIDEISRIENLLNYYKNLNR